MNKQDSKVIKLPKKQPSQKELDQRYLKNFAAQCKKWGSD